MEKIEIMKILNRRKEQLEIIEQIKTQINLLKELSGTIPTVANTPPGYTGNIKKWGYFESYTDKLEELEIKLREHESKLFKATESIRYFTDNLNKEETELIWYRYIFCYSWDLIAKKLCVCIRTVYRRHNAIIAKLMHMK